MARFSKRVVTENFPAMHPKTREITEFAEGGEADDRTVTIGYRDIDGEWQNYHDK